MKQQIKTHNVAYLKRLAKKLTKEQSISHHQSLDKVAVNFGFVNWKHFLRESSLNSKGKILSNNVSLSAALEISVDPYRNLIVAGLNELVKRQLISLTPTKLNSQKDDGHLFINIAGFPSVVLWSDRGFDELLISVWWKYDHSRHPQANLTGNAKESFNYPIPLADRQLYKIFVGVTASCWLERRSGKYLQGEKRDYISNIYTRSGELKNLKQIPIQVPMGYEISGPFHM
jgi:hypothetical protein